MRYLIHPFSFKNRKNIPPPHTILGHQLTPPTTYSHGGADVKSKNFNHLLVVIRLLAIREAHLSEESSVSDYVSSIN